MIGHTLDVSSRDFLSISLTNDTTRSATDAGTKAKKRQDQLIALERISTILKQCCPDRSDNRATTVFDRNDSLLHCSRGCLDPAQLILAR
jgi:hypothetical protein